MIYPFYKTMKLGGNNYQMIHHYKCENCLLKFPKSVEVSPHRYNHLIVCDSCYERMKTALCKPKASLDVKVLGDTSVKTEVDFNEPDHYHMHDMDTIEFLKKGFPPQTLNGFFIGNIVKYTQRYQYKNGRDDLVKIVDYAKRLLEWHDQLHELKEPRE